MANDPWAFRSAGMLCDTCMFFVRKKIVVNSVDGNRCGEEIDGPVGRCRRHAPTMNGYPVVYPSDWCGDHKLNENSIIPNHGHPCNSK